MSTPTTGRLLISHITLRGPELSQLYSCILRSPGISYADLMHFTGTSLATGDRFGLQEAPLREALNFLLTAQLVEQIGTVRRKAAFQTVPQACVTPFPLLLISRIGQHPDQRQRAISELYRQLVRQDFLAVSYSTLRNEAEKGALGDLFVWTSEKVSFWVRLCEYLGVVRSVARDNEVLLIPHPMFITTALQSQIVTQRSASLSECLHGLETSYVACYTARGAVHRGLAQTLIALHRLGVLRLSHRSDAAQSVLLGEWRVSDVELLPQEEDKA